MPTPIRLPDLGGGPVTLSHWYAEPEPLVTIEGPSETHVGEKAAFEAERLRRWFGR